MPHEVHPGYCCQEKQELQGLCCKLLATPGSQEVAEQGPCCSCGLQGLLAVDCHQELVCRRRRRWLKGRQVCRRVWPG